MKLLLVIFSLLFSTLSFAEKDDGIYAHINTNKGEIIVELTYKKTPLTVINFISLSEGTKNSNKELGVPFYDGLSFHRVIDDFMVQGGDPKGNGTGGPGYRFADEFTDLIHDRPGVLSMANSGPNTNGSQFFITHVPTPWLDGKHSVFGFVVDGMDVVNSIKQGDTLESISIERIGDEANQFIANEESFNRIFALVNEAIIAQKKLRQIDFENYANSIYPAANKNESGHFTLINKQGDGNQARVGQFVSVDISFKANNGQVMRKPGSLMEWTLGSGQMLISVIDSNVMEMSIGESRTLIAPYEYFFGVTPSGNIPQDSFIIFDLVLISVEDN